MNITDEVLKNLGAKLLDEKERIWQLNVFYKIKWARQNTFSGMTFDIWEFGYIPGKTAYGHFVDSVEELISFSYKDGLADGREGFKNDLKSFLGL